MIGNINNNLRRYVMICLLLMGAIVIGAMSMLSGHYFFEGMDGMLRGTMISAGRSVDVQPGAPKQVLRFNVAASWDDVDPEIRARFGGQTLHTHGLYKFVDRDTFLERPNGVYFLVKLEAEDGTEKYVTQVFHSPDEQNNQRRFLLSRESWIAVIGVAALAGFSLLLFLLMRSVAKPVEKLNSWAASIDKRQLDQPIPDFQYEELNHLATLIHKGMIDVTESVKREEEFVRHASHELRTPIAVIRSSVELLSRLNLTEEGKGKNAIRRIDNASHTMADLTETLLWLGKKDKTELSSQPVALASLLEQIKEDLSYLLVNKPVSVSLLTTPTTIMLPKTACRIVLGNLIRNAFQHTQAGEVSIVQDGNRVSINNCEDDTPNTTNTLADGDLGYGLGLQMVRRLTQQLNWGYDHQINATGHQVQITFEVNALLDTDAP